MTFEDRHEMIVSWQVELAKWFLLISGVVGVVFMVKHFSKPLFMTVVLFASLMATVVTLRERHF